MLTLTKLTLRDGNVVGDGINGFGAAIQVVSGTVTLDQVFVLANQSWFRGGAIGASAGSVYVVRSRLVDNQIAINFCGQGLTGIGGALFMTANGTTTGLLSVHQTELTGNVSTCKGGAIGVDSGTTFFLVNSTVSGNQALFQGGGVYIGNMSSNVGQTKAYLRLSTVANNTVTSTLEGISGGGLGLRSSSNGVPPTIQSAHGMLVALNTGPGDHADCGVTSGAPPLPATCRGTWLERSETVVPSWEPQQPTQRESERPHRR